MSWRAPLLVLAASVPLFFVNLGSPSIWDANEAFYVETPREMIERGDFIVPYFNFEPRLNKPVLSYWMVAGLYKLFGVSVSVQRFGIAIGGLILIACAGCLGWLCSRNAGLLAAAGLAVDPRLVMFARRIFIDVWIAAFMSLTLTFFALSERFPARRRQFLLLMYVTAGLGVLTKGPIAVLLPALSFTLYLAAHREMRRLREMMIPAGLLIVLAIVVPWYAALYQREGWTPILSFFVGENVGRYTTGIGFQSPRGFFFYLPVILADAFPLSLFLVAAAISFRRERTRIETLLWIWTGVIVLFFSFSHDKQDLYILPVVAAVAALGATAIARGGKAVTATCVVLGSLLAVAGAAVVYGSETAATGYRFGVAPLVAAIALAGGVAAGTLALRRRVLSAVATALVVLLTVNWLVVVRILSDLDQRKPVPALTAFLAPRITAEDVLATYNVALPSMVYYLQRRVNVHYAPDPFVADATAARRMFGVLSEADYAALGDRIRTRTCVLKRVPAFELKLKQVLTGSRSPELLLITNKCGIQ
jgi:4-amino-4-deoxy-L-arabinose transferase-like glycosyltransferase